MTRASLFIFFDQAIFIYVSNARLYVLLKSYMMTMHTSCRGAGIHYYHHVQSSQRQLFLETLWERHVNGEIIVLRFDTR